MTRRPRKMLTARIERLPFHRRRPIVTALLLLAGAGAIVDGRTRDDYTRYHNRVFRVARVVDGDTIDVVAADGRAPTTRVRFWGVDTPELAGESAPSMHHGPEASEFTRAALSGAQVRLILSPTRTRGLYGRLLAYVHVEPSGPMINEELVATGHAYADWRFPHPFQRRYRDLEATARRQGRGLWSTVTPELLPPWRRRMETRFGLIATDDHN